MFERVLITLFFLVLLYLLRYFVEKIVGLSKDEAGFFVLALYVSTIIARAIAVENMVLP